MPYTLMKGLAWVLIAVVIGIIIGWLLRSVAAKRQIERARAATADGVDHQELERLRGRVANLEPVVNERDRLRAELDRGRRDPTAPTPDAGPQALVETAPPAAAASSDSAADSTADVGSATAIVGHRIELDDLTAIEGIGPKIASLCQGIGIRTWAELSATEVSLLRTMLNDAGQRFKAHDPTTWPEQAGLLARGDWAAFKALTDRLDSGRPVD